MGCDIHLNVLVKTPSGWVLRKPPINCWPGDNRHYYAFGLLTGGDVRINPGLPLMFPPPKGWDTLPDDVAAAVPGGYGPHDCWYLLGDPGSTDRDDYWESAQAFSDETGWDVGDHSYSWLTLDEFDQFDAAGGWDQLLPEDWNTHRADHVAAWIGNDCRGTPHEYNGSTYEDWGRTEWCMDTLKAHLARPQDDLDVEDTEYRLQHGKPYLSQFRVSVWYAPTLRQTVPDLIELHQVMRGLRQEPDISDVILLFSFDS